MQRHVCFFPLLFPSTVTRISIRKNGRSLFYETARAHKIKSLSILGVKNILLKYKFYKQGDSYSDFMIYFGT